MIGRKISVDQFMGEVERDIPFYDQSGGGVTFTGGEPLQQKEFLHEVLLACKRQNIHTVVDTSGYTSWGTLRSILPLVDLFLYDVKHMDAKKHKQYTGVSNERILENLRNLSGAGACVRVRIPLIPGINDSDENLTECGEFLAGLPRLEGVEIMPYHEIGAVKYQNLGMHNKMGHTQLPSGELIDHSEEVFTKFGLRVFKRILGRNL